jgi:hypothetical protein
LHRFKPSAAVKIMKEVMAEKMAYTLDKDKKGCVHLCGLNQGQRTPVV